MSNFPDVLPLPRTGHVVRSRYELTKLVDRFVRQGTPVFDLDGSTGCGKPVIAGDMPPSGSLLVADAGRARAAAIAAAERNRAAGVGLLVLAELDPPFELSRNIATGW